MITTRPLTLTAIVDASYRAERGVTGIGIVLHATNQPGRAGPVIAWIAEAHTEVPVNAIELFAVSVRSRSRATAASGESGSDRTTTSCVAA